VLDKADKKLLKEMSFDRTGYKARLREYLIGALKEFYKARLGRKNGFTKWVDHWDTEARNLVQKSFAAALINQVKFSEKGRPKAAQEVIMAIKNEDDRMRRIAKNIVEKDYGVPMQELITDSDTEMFWIMVDYEIDTTFGGDV